MDTNKYIYIHLELQTTIFLMVLRVGWFQTFTWKMVVSPSINKKTGCLGYQVYIYIFHQADHLLDVEVGSDEICDWDGKLTLFSPKKIASEVWSVLPTFTLYIKQPQICKWTIQLSVLMKGFLSTKLFRVLTFQPSWLPFFVVLERSNTVSRPDAPGTGRHISCLLSFPDAARERFSKWKMA